MEVLSKEEIQFIDTYLKTSDVRFADIRMEMVDHVASEVEVRMSEDGIDFYNAFKWYMAENKLSLLKQNRNYLMESEKKLFKQMLRNLYSLQGSLLVIVVLGLVGILFEFMSSKYVLMFPVSICILAMTVYFGLTRKTRLRFSSLERVGFYLIFLPQYIGIALNYFVDGPLGGYSYIFVVLSVLIPVLLLQLGFQNFQFYKNKYQAIS
ncbi:hypothetical protein [Mangrovimonas sp. TPBH4]|uniref:hypothetical protein n=1 Tax=Mangrovimonas sp. TPBH4 TaxID=1645914 RepID=UPI0006B4C8E3|nr:hypothetical protein [Mangrovimonas sp. TPBH4]